jgi:phage gpG-like protein
MAKNRGGTESLRKKINALNAVKSSLPTILGNDMVNFFKGSFRKQGWEDEGVQAWKPRKSKSVKNKGKAILVQSGSLSRSIHMSFANWQKIRIESNLPYSAIHNEGLNGLAWGKHKFKMPKRKFMGRSRKLHNNLRAKMEYKINGAMRA